VRFDDNCITESYYPSVYGASDFHALLALRRGSGIEVARHAGTIVGMIQQYYGKQAALGGRLKDTHKLETGAD